MIRQYGLGEHLRLSPRCRLLALFSKFIEKDLVILTELYLVIFDGFSQVVCVGIAILQGMKMLEAIHSYLKDLPSLMQNLLMLVRGLLELLRWGDGNVLKDLIEPWQFLRMIDRHGKLCGFFLF